LLQKKENPFKPKHKPRPKAYANYQKIINEINLQKNKKIFNTV